MKKIFCAVLLAANFLFGTPAYAWWITFTNDSVDTSYDFAKMKRVRVAEVDTANLVLPSGVKLSDNDIRSLNASALLYVKKMKCKLPDEKHAADAVLKITLTGWKSEFHHHEPEKTVHLAAEYEYVGWERVQEPFRPPPHIRNGHGHRPPPPPPRYRWKTGSFPFPGSTKRLVRPARDVVYPAHDVYQSEVKALFELRDAKTDAVLMSREGTIDYFKSNCQAELFERLCCRFYDDFRKVVKQHKKKT